MLNWKWTAIAAALLGGGSMMAISQNTGPQPGYYGIAPGHDFPAAETTLDALRANQDLHGQRLHVWNVWAGLTEPTPDGKFARWETWYSEDEAFQSGAAPQGFGPHRVQRRFQVPNQLRLGAVPQAAGSGILSFVLFNYETYKHIRDNKLFSQAALDAFASSGGVDRHFANNRTVPEFPVSSMSLKVVWWPVAGDKVTGMPIWDGDPNPANTNAKPFTTWARAVAIDPKSEPAPGAVATVNLFGVAHPNSHVVGLSAFHAIKLDAALADQINANLSGEVQAVLGRNAKAGDYVVLAGMHMTTKEMKDWVWATFWWHDRPNDGPFAADRPGDVKAPWNHYLMSASYDLMTPAANDGGPHTAFNPWLEAGFKNGVNSNCMACHERASNKRPAFLPITRGTPDPTDPAFAAGSVRTDFLWSVPDNAH